ncbi:hypothetical protein NQ318_001906 [Aromia moschata]|uniref:ODAD1 central coiled coil region domain-containing protein n=1 Tax=Aromia moschata TaxID=1265417 RepID=A0AAV8Z3R6_9CUCU|nr:hypothetical protein NQ318_001906 [Aromia moschata]
MTARRKVQLTEEEKFELELQTEADLGRLQRNYTILERSTGEGGADVGGKLAKGRRVLKIYKKEQKNLQIDLEVATAEGKMREDDRQFGRLRELLKEYDEFDKQIKTQITHSKEIDGQIKIVNKKVLELEAQVITDHKYLDRTLRGEKTLQTLENKLEVQTRKFCTICSENVKLRDEINHLLIERFEFNKIWDRLINNLYIGKKFMLDLIEQATIAYDRREEWISKLQALRSKAYQDLLNHIQANL